jgi:hypothetical protein
MWTIGNITAAMFTGGLITSGITCISFLSKRNGMRDQNRYLQAYVVALILMVLTFDIVSIFLSYEFPILCFYSFQQIVYADGILGILFVLFGVAVSALTDGILVSVFLSEYIRFELFKMTVAFLSGLALFYGPKGTGEGIEVVGKCILDISCVFRVCYYVYVRRYVWTLQCIEFSIFSDSDLFCFDYSEGASRLAS